MFHGRHLHDTVKLRSEKADGIIATQVATGTLVLVQDADLEYCPNDIGKLVVPISLGQADVVLGSRRLNRGVEWSRVLTPYYHGVTILNFLCRIIYQHRISDEATCYKLFKRKDLLRMGLECERFEFCPEVLGKAFRMNLKIAEVPVSYKPRKLRQGKKIRLRDAFEAAFTLWRFRNWNPQS